MSEDGLTPEKLRQMMRKMDALALGDDVIAVSMLFPPDKALQFPDDKGTVHAISLRAWYALKAEAARNANHEIGGLLAGSPLAPFGGMRVVFEHDGKAWDEIVRRIIRSIEAAEAQSSFVSRLLLELKWMRPPGSAQRSSHE